MIKEELLKSSNLKNIFKRNIKLVRVDELSSGLQTELFRLYMKTSENEFSAILKIKSYQLLHRIRRDISRNLYQKEYHLYKIFLNYKNLPVPSVYWLHIDEKKNTSYLLLEDLASEFVFKKFENFSYKDIISLIASLAKLAGTLLYDESIKKLFGKDNQINNDFKKKFVALMDIPGLMDDIKYEFSLLNKAIQKFNRYQNPDIPLTLNYGRLTPENIAIHKETNVVKLLSFGRTKVSYLTDDVAEVYFKFLLTNTQLNSETLLKHFKLNLPYKVGIKISNSDLMKWFSISLLKLGFNILKRLSIELQNADYVCPDSVHKKMYESVISIISGII